MTEPVNDSSINSALQHAGTGKFQYIILAVSSAAGMAVIIENQSMAFILPAAKCDLNISTAEQGFINSVSFIGVTVASHFWGFMTDTWGRRDTMKLTLMLTFATSCLSSMSWNGWTLAVTRFFVGFCSAGVKTSATSYCGEFFSSSNISTYFTLFTTFSSLSFIVHPLLGLAIMTLDFRFEWLDGFVYAPWRLFVVVGSMMTGIAYVALLFLPEGPKYMTATGKPDEALHTLRRIYAVNSGRSSEEYIVKSIMEDPETPGGEVKKVKSFNDAIQLVWNQTWPLFCRPHLANMLMLCTLMFFTFAVSQGMQLWTPQIFLFYEESKNTSLLMCQVVAAGHSNALITATRDHCKTYVVNAKSLRVLLLIGTAVVSIVLIAGFTMKAFGKKTVHTSWILANATATFGLIWSTSFPLTVVCMVFLISTVALMNNHAAISGELFPTKYKGMAVSLMTMAARMGSVAGSNVMATILFTHCDLLFSMNAGILFVGTVVCWYTLRNPKS